MDGDEATPGGLPEFLTTKELAEVLRLKERRVYDLAASGEIPCSRVTGKLLFPRAAVRAWLDASIQGGAATAHPRPTVFLGSHDPLLDWALRESGSAIASYFDGSLDGLARFAAGEGIATGLHVFDGNSGTWNINAVRQAGAGRGAVLVGFCQRRRGLIIGEGLRGMGGLPGLKGRRLARRQRNAGAEALLAHLAATAGIDLAETETALVARSEADAALAVAEDRADAALGLEALARQYGLGFLPLMDEPFDLLVDRAAWFGPAMQTFLAFCRTPALAERAAAMPGYDVSPFGTVRWNDG